MSGFYWLASYPKSGNTWIRLALQSLAQHGGRISFAEGDRWFPIASAREPFDSMLGVESSDMTSAEIDTLRPRVYEALACEATVPLIRKVHDAWTMTPACEPLFPPAVTLGAVYVVRDPRDVAISYAHHCSQTIDRIIETMADPEAAMARSRRSMNTQMRQKLLTWSGHVSSWMDAPGIPRLTVRYEDIVAGTETVLAEVASFCGMNSTADEIAAATVSTRFDTLRAQEEQSRFCEKPAGMQRFFRQGKAGGWQKVLTNEQVLRIERDHGEIMARLRYL